MADYTKKKQKPFLPGSVSHGVRRSPSGGQENATHCNGNDQNHGRGNQNSQVFLFAVTLPGVDFVRLDCHCLSFPG
ncbi:MAG: hypothetical protein KDJ62_10030 [Rhodobiaceae bacterium]|nr:hypothetical protein [Rhodobiaceae bacterium]MCC0049978.1 hypothetical protein [Rhodobiaceae bacterium]